jgi:tRNA-Thr(GGU) m(6)t(6)A37 methyltransferase TsaA
MTMQRKLLTSILVGCFALVPSCDQGPPGRHTEDGKYTKRHVTVMRAIGTIRSPYGPENKPPPQGAFAPDVESRIVLASEYEEALTDLESFSHVIVLYAFDRSRAWSSFVLTSSDGKRHGLFATRSPNRPNPIALTVVKLVKREGTTLRVAGLDAFDGTPVLDLKPYIAWFDSLESATAGWLGDVEQGCCSRSEQTD